MFRLRIFWYINVCICEGQRDLSFNIINYDKLDSFGVSDALWEGVFLRKKARKAIKNTGSHKM